MSEIAQGPDRWLASDGTWYPPSSRLPPAVCSLGTEAEPRFVEIGPQIEPID